MILPFGARKIVTYEDLPSLYRYSGDHDRDLIRPTFCWWLLLGSTKSFASGGDFCQLLTPKEVLRSILFVPMKSYSQTLFIKVFFGKQRQGWHWCEFVNQALLYHRVILDETILVQLRYFEFPRDSLAFGWISRFCILWGRPSCFWKLMETHGSTQWNEGITRDIT